MYGTSVKYSWPTGCKSEGFSVASITVLTALAGKRSFLEGVGTAPLSADMLFLKHTSI